MGLPLLAVGRAEADERLAERIRLGVEIREADIRSKEELIAARQTYYTWTEYNGVLLRRLFTDDSTAEEYEYTGPMLLIGNTSLNQDIGEFRQDVEGHVRRLESIRARLDLYEEPATSPLSEGGPASGQAQLAEELVETLDGVKASGYKNEELLQRARDLNAALGPTYAKVYGATPLMISNYPPYVWWPRAREAASQALAYARVEPPAEGTQVASVPAHAGSKKVFVVHGHDHALKEAVAALVRRLGYEPVVLHLRPDIGQTIIEKLEREASDAAYAVVLLTPDDEGRVRGGDGVELRPRARQNVVLEYGYFLGLLGRGRVAALVSDPHGLEPPTDVDGVLYIAAEAVEDLGWHVKLALEMRAAGLEVDLNDIEE
jgi:predicted nucleotide-binding protein